MDKEKVQERARKNAQAMREKYGDDYFRNIGKLGGKANVAAHGAERLREIGSVGGKTVSERKGRDFFIEIGRKGGEASRKRKKAAQNV